MRIDKPLERIHEHRDELNRHLDAADRHRTSVAKELRLAHCAAYRLAAEYCKVAKDADARNALIDFLRSSGLSVDDWLTTLFGRYDSQPGQDYSALIWAVDHGMTLKQYLDKGVSYFVGQWQERKRQERDQRSGASLAADSRPVAADKNSLDYWRQRCRHLERENRELSRRNRRLQRQRARATAIPTGTLRRTGTDD